MRTSILWCFTGLTLFAGPAAAQHQPTLNSYVLQVVDDFARHRAKGGYDLHAAFTRDLQWGPDCCVKASSPPKTMCVAATAEVIIEAVRRYSEATGDRSAYASLSLADWRSGAFKAVRPHLFMYAGTQSRGTGHTLKRFGIGEEKTFPHLKPGDFINFNRTNRTGHSAVFLGYLSADRKVSSNYSPAVVGFRYFSAQGAGKPDAGMAYRNAYFAPDCPAAQPGELRDCGVIKATNNMQLLDGGTLYAPPAWRVAEARAALTADVSRAVSSMNPGATRSMVDLVIQRELDRELSPHLSAFTGETID